jgi:hypothetical protein
MHWSDPGAPNLQELTNLYSTLRSADVLTIGEWDEDHVRNVAGLPDRPEGVGVGERVKAPPPASFPTPGEFRAQPTPRVEVQKTEPKPQAVRKVVERDAQGRIIAVTEEPV